MKTILTKPFALFTILAFAAVPMGCNGEDPAKNQAAKAVAGPSQWTEDYEGALARAKAEKKMVFLDFTGSDWCPPCIQLQKEVFSKKEFLDFAKENLVLVEIDFPRGKPQAKEIAERNERLQEQYGVIGYPTMVVLSPDGKKMAAWMLERMETPESMIAKIKALKK